MWHFTTDGSGLSFTPIKLRPNENVSFIFVTSLPVCLVDKTMYLSAAPWKQRSRTPLGYLCYLLVSLVTRQQYTGSWTRDPPTLKTTVMSDDLLGVFWTGGAVEILWREGRPLVLLGFFFIAVDFTVRWHLMTIKFTRNYLFFCFSLVSFLT